MPRKQHTYHYIYKTTCKVTGKYYVGMHSTSNLEDDYIGSGKRLWYSIKKHGRDNHQKEILEFLSDRKSLKERERELVNDSLIQDPMCMNIMKGGEGGRGFDKGTNKGSVTVKDEFGNFFKVKKDDSPISISLVSLTHSLNKGGKSKSGSLCWINLFNIMLALIVFFRYSMPI